MYISPKKKVTYLGGKLATSGENLVATEYKLVTLATPQVTTLSPGNQLLPLQNC